MCACFHKFLIAFHVLSYAENILSKFRNVKVSRLPRPVLQTFEHKIKPTAESAPRRSFSVTGGPRAPGAAASSSASHDASRDAMIAAVDWDRLPKKITDALLPFQREGVACVSAYTLLANIRSLTRSTSTCVCEYRLRIARGGNVLIADDMGLGKTLQVLLNIFDPTLISRLKLTCIFFCCRH